MKIETEKMMEAFVNHSWEVNDDWDLLELYNADRTRKMEYRSRGTGRGSSVVLGLSFLNAAGGWTEVFSMKHYQYGEIELVSFSVETRGRGTSGIEVDRVVSYDSERGRETRSLSFPDFCPTGRVFNYRKELLPEIESLPAEVDYEATANMFIEQVVRGEMTRPVLVPIEADI